MPYYPTLDAALAADNATNADVANFVTSPGATQDALAATFVAAVDVAGNLIPGHRARVVFDANGDVDDITLEAT